MVTAQIALQGPFLLDFPRVRLTFTFQEVFREKPAEVFREKPAQL